MVEGHAEDRMIEIGDPTEEPTSPEPPPQVVIEYRERGVPWMLIPPLLMISAVGAILGYHKFGPRDQRPTTALIANSTASTAPVVEPVAPNPPPPPAPTVEANPPSAPTIPEVPLPTNPEPASASPFDLPSSAAVEIPAVEPPLAVDIPPSLDADPRSNPVPRVQGLGFDPKALEAERNPTPPADPALAPAGKQEREEKPDRPMEPAARPDNRPQPEEVDADLLPPDPRLARARQQQRLVEAMRQVESDRVRFHAELREICRELRERSGPAIVELVKQFEMKVDPIQEKRAVSLFGKTGRFAGADQPTRIRVLRELGWPEPMILQDIYDCREKIRIKERGGPKTPDEATYNAALYLLKNPPVQSPPPASRPASTSRPGPSAGATAPSR